MSLEYHQNKTALAGLTVVELVVVLAILGVLAGIVGMNLRPFGGDLENAAQETVSFFKLTRAKAMARTAAYRVVFASETRLRAEFANTCNHSGTWTNDAQLGLELREGVVMDATGLEAGDVLLCFNSRGLSTQNPSIDLVGAEGRTRSVEVYLGGAVVIK